MKKETYNILFLYTLLFAGIWACEEQEEPTARDPLVSIFLLNKDSLDKVNIIEDSLDAELAAYDVVIANLKTDAASLADSLIVLTDSIANGGNLEAEKNQVINDLDTLNLYLTGVEKEDSTVNVRRAEWALTAATINSGSVHISAIENIKNGLSVFYEDSSTTWKLPLDMNEDGIDVNITIDEEIYNLELSYNRSTTANEKNRVTIGTSNFSIIKTDFNNSSVSCTNCEAAETTVYVEF
ncbi:MAG: hypothetical protein ABJF04_15765 [Reichenbachiella sp.]|uniref:hypothetical protein n=1 Tax=Reichenbachiella sp. TaxID=2184521 RepID=UPI003265E31D